MKILRLDGLKRSMVNRINFSQDGSSILCIDSLCSFTDLPDDVEEIDLHISDVPKRGFFSVVVQRRGNDIYIGTKYATIEEGYERNVMVLAEDPKEADFTIILWERLRNAVFGHFGYFGDIKKFYVRIMA